jgi:drug/metabolite transporter (DMT)-like permease
VTAVLGGLGASVCFAISALCASAASRRIGAVSTLAWVMTVGLVIVVPPLVLLANAGPLSPRAVWLLAIAGFTNIAGLQIEYVAFRRGKVGVITPVVSTEGAIAAVIAVIAGLQISTRTAVLLVVVTLGVVLAAAHPDPPELAAAHPDPPDPAAAHPDPPDPAAAHPDPPDPAKDSTGMRSAVLALPCAILFGISLYTTGHVGQQVSVLWVLLPARLLGTSLITAPLAARHQLEPPRSALPLVLTAGTAEVLGILSYTLGARHQLAIAAVLASQFPALAAVGAYFAFRERLTKLQLAGLLVVAACVGLLAAGGT